MKSVFSIFLLLLCSIALLSCASGLHVEKTPLTEINENPPEARPSPVGFNEIRFAVPTGTPVMSQSPKGFLGLFLCDLPYGVIEQGVSGRSFPNDEYRRIFFETLVGQGYDVAGDPGRMFDEEEDMMRAVYAVGARVMDIKSDTCRRSNAWGAFRGVHGEASVTIEWTIYDMLNRRNILKKETKGYGQLQNANYEGAQLLLQEAFAAAAHNLGADSEFHDLVFFGTPPQNIPGTFDDPEEDAPIKFEPRENVEIANQPLSSVPAAGRLEDIVKSTVLIQTSSGHGSGFFITKQGHIITNAHVVGHAAQVRVVTSGKEEKLVAGVLWRDARRDVALLKLQHMPDDLKIVTLPVRTNLPAVGDEVYAIGSPRLAQLQDTVTKGIVSALRFTQREKQSYIQADVDIYGGNSGGPIIDANGNIIGITTLGFFISEDALGGLNWFIPIGDALEKLDISPSNKKTSTRPANIIPEN
ncbi:MAG: trypsin-like peptidase domain-containing protein [Proteobacteria bacterium]|nr:trypsin-like peptidase domain-containing protein [Pseudomonadota bacterium]